MIRKPNNEDINKFTNLLNEIRTLRVTKSDYVVEMVDDFAGDIDHLIVFEYCEVYTLDDMQLNFSHLQ